MKTTRRTLRRWHRSGAILLLSSIPLILVAIYSAMDSHAGELPPLGSAQSQPRLISRFGTLDASSPTASTVPAASPQRWKLDERKDVFVWKRTDTVGPLDRGFVEKLITDQHAEALETRLTPELLSKLRAELVTIDAAVKTAAKIYVKEAQKAKDALRAIPDRRILIRSRPREADSNYPNLLRARAEVENTGKGAVWGEPWHTTGEIHLIVYWQEWPDLRNVFRSSIDLINQRNSRSRAFISRHYASGGMGIFSKDR